MEIGDTVIVSNEGLTRKLTIFAIREAENLPYIIYYLMNEHRLYVRKGYSIPSEPLDIKNQIILFESEIEKDDYYLMISVSAVLPL